jgi:hypothetical protein
MRSFLLVLLFIIITNSSIAQSDSLHKSKNPFIWANLGFSVLPTFFGLKGDIDAVIGKHFLSPVFYVRVESTESPLCFETHHDFSLLYGRYFTEEYAFLSASLGPSLVYIENCEEAESEFLLFRYLDIKDYKRTHAYYAGLAVKLEAITRYKYVGFGAGIIANLNKKSYVALTINLSFGRIK